MASQAVKMERVFKTSWLTKAARKAHITDDELCSAIRQVMLGQVDDLGGGVFKKRVGKNQYRSIILARTGHYWIYEYLFAKQDRANIELRSDRLMTWAAVFLRSGSGRINTAPSFLREQVTIGSMSISSLSRIGPISRTMNYLSSAGWSRYMPD